MQPHSAHLQVPATALPAKAAITAAMQARVLLRTPSLATTRFRCGSHSLQGRAPSPLVASGGDPARSERTPGRIHCTAPAATTAAPTASCCRRYSRGLSPPDPLLPSLLLPRQHPAAEDGQRGGGAAVLGRARVPLCAARVDRAEGDGCAVLCTSESGRLSFGCTGSPAGGPARSR